MPKLPPATAPARGPAFLFLLSAALMLGGCSLLPSKNDDKDTDPSLIAATGDPAFSLVVDAPKEVRELLEKHLELRRYRYQSDLQRRELTRLLGATSGLWHRHDAWPRHPWAP